MVALGASLGFPSGWTTGFEVATSILTLMMVLVIQHTQGREQAATQRKLDELLRASPGADRALIMLEEESDDTIKDVEDSQRLSKPDQTHGGEPDDENGTEAAPGTPASPPRGA